MAYGCDSSDQTMIFVFRFSASFGTIHKIHKYFLVYSVYVNLLVYTIIKILRNDSFPFCGLFHSKCSCAQNCHEFYNCTILLESPLVSC